ncbi:hypothetical protein CBR_g21981 [Chara braunii]|uniref:Reverse transcriptase domain-containing protein n=1 Tax=Chara braunii TaxID=69332 RepID=A0A388L209_CHABU|nr:hypothetical protein CBR_g21981 [Chara braunii]|eukprot:GBG76233.1 hypothetical protein CBR_g21981 [Chara braunii]
MPPPVRALPPPPVEAPVRSNESAAIFELTKTLISLIQESKKEQREHNARLEAMMRNMRPIAGVRCPLGICNAPAMFQRAMNMTFQNFVNKTRLTQGMINFCVIVYMDNILVYLETYHGHAQNIEWTLGALRNAGFKIALEKSDFFLSEISFLGYVVTRGGLRPDSIKVAAVKEAPFPTSLTQVRAFLGLASYYRRFIKGFAAIAQPLTNLLRKDQPLSWDAECQQAFATLKDALATTPILIWPDPSKQFILITDWQPEAISAILAQKGNDGREHVIEYASRTVPDERRNDAAPQGECYAVVWGIQHFHPYLYGQKFRLVTDHESLLALKKLTNYTGMIGRWVVRLQEYDFDIVHRKTERPGNADGLTRLHRPVKWSACVEGAVERIPSSQQQYLDPRTVCDPAFFKHPMADQLAAIQEEEEEEESTESDEGEDEREESGKSDEVLGEEDETPEEGSYSKHSEGEQSEEEEEDDEGEEENEEGPAESEWEAVPEEALRMGTEAEDPEAARKREETAAGKRQLEFVSGASLHVHDDPNQDPEPPRPEHGDLTATTLTPSTWRRSRSPSSPTRPPNQLLRQPLFDNCYITNEEALPIPATSARGAFGRRWVEKGVTTIGDLWDDTEGDWIKDTALRDTLGRLRSVEQRRQQIIQAIPYHRGGLDQGHCLERHPEKTLLCSKRPTQGQWYQGEAQGQWATYLRIEEYVDEDTLTVQEWSALVNDKLRQRLTYQATTSRSPTVPLQLVRVYTSQTSSGVHQHEVILAGRPLASQRIDPLMGAWRDDEGKAIPFCHYSSKLARKLHSNNRPSPAAAASKLNRTASYTLTISEAGIRGLWTQLPKLPSLKFAAFLWMLSHAIVPCTVWLFEKGMDIVTKRRRCASGSRAEETISHLVWSCPASKRIWLWWACHWYNFVGEALTLDGQLEGSYQDMVQNDRKEICGTDSEGNHPLDHLDRQERRASNRTNNWQEQHWLLIELDQDRMTMADERYNLRRRGANLHSAHGNSSTPSSSAVQASQRSTRGERAAGSSSSSAAAAAGVSVRRLRTWQIAACCIILAIYFGFVINASLQLLDTFPKPVEESTCNRNVFSEERAMKTVRKLAIDIRDRQTGTHGLKEALDYLRAEVKLMAANAPQEIRVEIEDEKVNGSFSMRFLGFSSSFVYNDIPNLAVSLSCAAVGMEVMQTVIESGNPPSVPLIFLFNGGEEIYSMGAHGFMRQSKWRDDIGAVINLEATGSSGPNVMFRFGPGTWPAQVYADNAVHPSASSISQDLMPYVLGDTDFRMFSMEFGDIPGVDIAFILDGQFYHSPYDNVENLRTGIMQSMGDNVFGLINGFARSPRLVASKIRQARANTSLGEGMVSEEALLVFDVYGKIMVALPRRSLWILALNCCAVAFVWPLFVPRRYCGIDSILHRYLAIAHAAFHTYLGGAFAILFPAAIAVGRTFLTRVAMPWFGHQVFALATFVPAALAALLMVQLWREKTAGKVHKSTRKMHSIEIQISLSPI